MFKRYLILVVAFVSVVSVSKAVTIRQLFRESNRKAFEKIVRLAKNGNVEAMYYAGLSYEIGNGTKLNYQKAFEWYKKAANLGYARAQYNIAFMYEYGYGTKKNLVKAYKWFYILGDQKECHLVGQKMTQSQIKQAKKLATQWRNKWLKGILQ